mmetsp:Transcript_2214/g.7289  ORF Transcript_2214/g.7289 Transcript_2214/m.7289 type:complete len:206 (+) Transcript_2214:130-747(+)
MHVCACHAHVHAHGHMRERTMRLVVRTADCQGDCVRAVCNAGVFCRALLPGSRWGSGSDGRLVAANSTRLPLPAVPCFSLRLDDGIVDGGGPLDGGLGGGGSIRRLLALDHVEHVDAAAGRLWVAAELFRLGERDVLAQRGGLLHQALKELHDWVRRQNDRRCARPWRRGDGRRRGGAACACGWHEGLRRHSDDEEEKRGELGHF